MHENPIIFRQCKIPLHNICLREPGEQSIYFRVPLEYFVEKKIAQHLRSKSNGHRTCL